MRHLDGASAGVGSSGWEFIATIRGAGQTMRRHRPKVHHRQLASFGGNAVESLRVGLHGKQGSGDDDKNGKDAHDGKQCRHFIA